MIVGSEASSKWKRALGHLRNLQGRRTGRFLGDSGLSFLVSHNRKCRLLPGFSFSQPHHSGAF